MLSTAVSAFCNVFIGSDRLTSVEESPVPQTITVATGISATGLMGSATDSSIDEASEPV